MSHFRSGSPPAVGTMTCVRIVGSGGVLVISVRAVSHGCRRTADLNGVIALYGCHSSTPRLEPMFGVQVNGKSC